MPELAHSLRLFCGGIVSVLIGRLRRGEGEAVGVSVSACIWCGPYWLRPCFVTCDVMGLFVSTPLLVFFLSFSVCVCGVCVC